MFVRNIKILFGIVLLSLSSTTLAVNEGMYSDKIRFVRSFIENIKIPLAVAVQEATYQCGQSGVAPCTCSSTTLSDGTGATDVYVDVLSIDSSCVITLEVKATALASSALTTATVTNEVPSLTPALARKIVLTPDRSSVVIDSIKSWACTTSVDGALQPMFQGMSTIVDGATSILSSYNDDPYLGTCLYDSALNPV